MTNETKKQDPLEKLAKNSYTNKTSFLEGFKQIFYNFFSYSDHQKNSQHFSKDNLAHYSRSIYRNFI